MLVGVIVLVVAEFTDPLIRVGRRASLSGSVAEGLVELSIGDDFGLVGELAGRAQRVVVVVDGLVVTVLGFSAAEFVGFVGERCRVTAGRPSEIR